MTKIITIYNWTKQASIFNDNGRFNIYKTTTKIYTSNKIYNLIRGATKYILEMQEILNDIKTYFLKLNVLTFGFTPDQKDESLILWPIYTIIQWLIDLLSYQSYDP